MSKGEFLSSGEIQRFLTAFPTGFQDIALELRDLLISCCPEASERILWGGLSYHDSARGGPVRGAICQIEFHPEHVRLSFIHGVRLEDPHALLQGKQKSKRFIQIASYEEAPWEDIRSLIEAAARLDPATFAPLTQSRRE
jgi:hypothetical protein